MCVPPASSACSITLRRAAHVFVVKLESSEVRAHQYSPSFSEGVGQKRLEKKTNRALVPGGGGWGGLPGHRGHHDGMMMTVRQRLKPSHTPWLLLCVRSCWRVPLKDNTSWFRCQPADPGSAQTHSGPPLSRHGVTVGFSLPGRDFLVTQHLTSQTAPASSGHLRPLWALIPTKACWPWELPSADKLCYQVSTATCWGMRASGSNPENFLVWKRVWTRSNQSRCKFVSVFPP